jgi:glutamate-1-semialdehyde aminotransferase
MGDTVAAFAGDDVVAVWGWDKVAVLGGMGGYTWPCLQGKMQWLWDQDGRRYLDMFAGIVTVSVGHCHPRVTAALEKQIHRYLCMCAFKLIILN